MRSINTSTIRSFEVENPFQDKLTIVTLYKSLPCIILIGFYYLVQLHPYTKFAIKIYLHDFVGKYYTDNWFAIVSGRSESIIDVRTNNNSSMPTLILWESPLQTLMELTIG